MVVFQPSTGKILAIANNAGADRQGGTGLHHEDHHLHGPDQLRRPHRVDRGRAQLKAMMQAVVTSGTADIQGQEQPNSWIVAFDPAQDVAVAGLVVNAGYGAQFARPEAKAFLDSF
jgi:cell division protein FtsI/penicillin-binding protein 2